MAIIGKFKKQQDGSYRGQIATLLIKTKASLVPVETVTERGPVYRIFAGFGECGAVFNATSQDQRDYLSAKLDDPGFPAPVYGALFPADEDPDMLHLVWSRPDRK
jgi:uncharacterized protein (DUF736 family)